MLKFKDVVLYFVYWITGNKNKLALLKCIKRIEKLLAKSKVEIAEVKKSADRYKEMVALLEFSKSNNVRLKQWIENTKTDSIRKLAIAKLTLIQIDIETAKSREIIKFINNED